MSRSCDEIRQLLDGWLDRELTREAQGEVEAHLVTCAVCAELFARAAAMSERLRVLGRAAEAIAAAPAERPRSRRWFYRPLVRIAAAIAVLAAAGISWRVAMRRARNVEPGPQVVRIEPETTPVVGRRPFNLIVADSSPELVVPIESRNPHVQIVMFYEPAVSEDALAPAGTSTAPSRL